jgi:hypothetical protein
LRAWTRFRRYRGVRSRFHVFRVGNRFWPYRGCRVPFSCFARLNSFSAVPRATDPVFMFCAPELIFSGSEGIGSRFHVLRARTIFRGFRERRVPFSCFARPGSFSAVTRASGSRFHVLRCRTRFRRYRGHRVTFSCFGRTDSFSAVPRASGPVFMFCATGLFFGGNEGVESRFHVLLSQTHFRRYRGRRVPFSCFALPDTFLGVTRASGPVFMFCAPGLLFGGTEGVRSRFHVLRARTRFRG